MDNETAVFMQSMSILKLQPGDIVVLKHPDKLPSETCSALVESVKNIIAKYGYDVQVLMLMEGMDIGVMRKES